jgi:hypothetical protein
MEPTRQDVNNSDEIDLAQFFRWIGRGFKGAGHSILFGLASVRAIFLNNRLFFAGIIGLGLLLGVLYSQLLTQDLYKASMVLSCDYLNDQSLQSNIDKLNRLAPPALARELQIDEPMAKNIQRFEYKWIVSEDDVLETEVLRTELNAIAPAKKELIDKVVTKLENESKNAFEVNIFIFNPEDVKPLETAIVNYFRSNPYVKRRVEAQRAKLVNRKNKLLAESKKLDSLKAVMYANMEQFARLNRGSNNVILGEEKVSNPLDVFREDFNLYGQLQKTEEELYLQPDFEVVGGLASYRQRENASLTKILFISFLISVAMGYVIIGVWKFDRYLATYPTKS